MYIKITSFLVLGLGKSGYSVSELLIKKGAMVYIYDQTTNEIIQKNIKLLEEIGCEYASDITSTISKCDVVVVSPGVSVVNNIVLEARKQGKRIIGELELASYLLLNPIVAVTGTNGKTTTCSLIGHILNESQINAKVVGNIGTPLSSVVDKVSSEEVLVCEVSSFQLETACRFAPHISVILNITPDHLERHFNMNNYIYLKSKLILTLKESEYACLNYDDENVRSLSSKTLGKIVWFSKTKKVEGVYLENNNIYFFDEKVATLSDITLKGEHNTQNVLSTIAVLKLLGLKNEEIVNGLKTFKGVKHRIEQVNVVNGITFYNDSKATNPDATLKAVESINNNLFLILGGYDKGLDYTEFFTTIKEKEYIKQIILMGETSEKMYNTCVQVGIKNVMVIKDFTLALKVAYISAKSGDNILLSPATSSFDQFTGYEERGERFIEIASTLS